MRWTTKLSCDVNLCQEFWCQKLLKSDNYSSTYRQQYEWMFFSETRCTYNKQIPTCSQTIVAQKSWTGIDLRLSGACYCYLFIIIIVASHHLRPGWDISTLADTCVSRMYFCLFWIPHWYAVRHCEVTATLCLWCLPFHHGDKVLTESKQANDTVVQSCWRNEWQQDGTVSDGTLLITRYVAARLVYEMIIRDADELW